MEYICSSFIAQASENLDSCNDSLNIAQDKINLLEARVTFLENFIFGMVILFIAIVFVNLLFRRRPAEKLKSKVYQELYGNKGKHYLARQMVRTLQIFPNWSASAYWETMFSLPVELTTNFMYSSVSIPQGQFIKTMFGLLLVHVDILQSSASDMLSSVPFMTVVQQAAREPAELFPHDREEILKLLLLFKDQNNFCGILDRILEEFQVVNSPSLQLLEELYEEVNQDRLNLTRYLILARVSLRQVDTQLRDALALGLTEFMPNMGNFLRNRF